MLILKHCLLISLGWPSSMSSLLVFGRSNDLDVFVFYDCCIVPINTIYV